MNSKLCQWVGSEEVVMMTPLRWLCICRSFPDATGCIYKISSGGTLLYVLKRCNDCPFSVMNNNYDSYEYMVGINAIMNYDDKSLIT
mmetsp:Transcript_30247/g.43229  ORF Transcript_30247/g.43229 Transcript_30247/m.43229 type:complete len:87 (-) Transcript_30247:90-350(-)